MMLIYDAQSPAPRCLRMFLLEKQLRLPAVTIDVMTGENRQPPYLAINPAGQTPALRLDDGPPWPRRSPSRNTWKNATPNPR